MSDQHNRRLKSLPLLAVTHAGTVSASVRQMLISEYSRWVLWLPVLLGIGIGFYFSLSFEPAWYIGPLIFGFLVWVVWLARHRVVILVFAIAALVVTAGFTAGTTRTLLVGHTVLDREIGPSRVSGQVIEVQARETGARLIVSNPDIAGLPASDTPQKVRINVNTDSGSKVRPGDWVRMIAVLRPPQEPASPGAFDFQRHIFFQGIGATGFSYGAPHITHRENKPAFATRLQEIRNDIGVRIRAVLPGTTGAVAAALVTGDRGAIPESTFHAMRDAGLAHLLAISGLHVGLVAGLVFSAARAIFACVPALALRYPIKTWAAGLGIIAALGYTLLAGATIPTLRAFAMMSIVFGAIMIGRKGISPRLVAWAASVILIFRPESLVGASFQLSFAAVIGLVATYEFLNYRYRGLWLSSHPAKRAGLYVLGVLFTSVIASLATAPFAAYHFHHLSSYGLVSNLIAVPTTASWIMPWALAALALMPLGFEQLALIPMGWGIELVLVSAETVAPLPGNVQFVPAMPIISLVLFTIGGLWLCLWWQRWRLIGLLPLLAALVIFIANDRPRIIAAANGQVFAVRYDDDMIMLGPRRTGNRFTKRIWLERAGLTDGETPYRDRQGTTVNCDSIGCALGGDLSGVSLVWQEAALLEDCWRARVIISAIPVRVSCPAPEIIIDRFDLWRYGAHAFYAGGGHYQIENSHSLRGIRPWTGEARGTRSRTGKSG